MSNYQIIIVDDDTFSNLICSTLIRSVNRNLDVTVFQDPTVALKEIQASFINSNKKVFPIILLDINMPQMDGWEFLDKLEQIEESIINNISVFVISSSVDPKDSERAKNSKLVVDMISKPISKNLILEMLDKVGKRKMIGKI